MGLWCPSNRTSPREHPALPSLLATPPHTQPCLEAGSPERLRRPLPSLLQRTRSLLSVPEVTCSGAELALAGGREGGLQGGGSLETHLG